MNKEDSTDNLPKDALDRLLADSLLQPPDNFSETVMRKIERDVPYNYAQHSLTETTRAEASRPLFWQAVALVASTIVGASQVIGFIFGLWIPATVG